MGLMNTGQLLKIHDFNDLMLISSQNPDGSTGAAYQNATVNVTLKKDEYVYMRSDARGNSFGACTITATPQTSPIVVLESQDEIFTDYVDWTPTITGHGTVTNLTAQYRRVGTNIEFFGSYTTGTVSTDLVSITLPPGLNISTGVAAISAGPQLGRFTSNETILNSRYLYFQPGDTDKFYITEQSAARAPTTRLQGDQASTSTTICDFWGSIPIQGYNANFNPLLSLPLTDLGQPTETWFVSMVSTSNFWDGTGTQRQWNEALLVGPNTSSTTAGNIANSNLIEIADRTSGTNTVTAIVAKQDITLNVVISSFLNSTAELLWLNQNDQTLAKEQTHNSDNYVEICTVEVFLRQGEYIWSQTDAYARGGGITITAKKALSGNLSHIIKPAVATLKNVLAYNANGGSSTTGAWNKCPLNTVQGESWFVTLNDSTDVFTLEPGTYEIDAVQPIVRPNRNQVVIYNEDQTTYAIIGTSNYFDDSNVGCGESSLRGVITITTSTQFSFRYRVTNAQSNTGLGEPLSADSAVSVVYGQVRIRKLK